MRDIIRRYMIFLSRYERWKIYQNRAVRSVVFKQYFIHIHQRGGDVFNADADIVFRDDGRVKMFT